MMRWWWLTLEERQRKYREMQKTQPESLTPKEPTKRRPYQWGAKDFLSGFDIGECRLYEGKFPWRNLQSIARHMSLQFGAQFAFSTVRGKKYITRVL